MERTETRRNIDLATQTVPTDDPIQTREKDDNKVYG